MKKKLFVIVMFNFTFAFLCADIDTFFEDGKLIETMHINSKEGLRVRETPSLESKKIILLPNNLSIEVVEIGNETIIDGIKAPWVKIRVPNYENISKLNPYGWIFGGYLKKNNYYPESTDYDYYWDKLEKLYTEIIKSSFNVYDDNFSKHPTDESFDNFIKKYKPTNTEKILIRNIDNPEAKSFLIKYLYEYDGIIVEARDVNRGEDKYIRSFTGMAITKNFTNSLGLKIGMNIEELKSLLGNCVKNSDIKNMYYASLDEFGIICFTFDNESLVKIYCSFDGGLGN